MTKDGRRSGSRIRRESTMDDSKLPTNTPERRVPSYMLPTASYIRSIQPKEVKEAPETLRTERRNQDSATEPIGRAQDSKPRPAPKVKVEQQTEPKIGKGKKSQSKARSKNTDEPVTLPIEGESYLLLRDDCSRASSADIVVSVRSRDFAAKERPKIRPPPPKPEIEKASLKDSKKGICSVCFCWPK